MLEVTSEGLSRADPSPHAVANPFNPSYSRIGVPAANGKV